MNKAEVLMKLLDSGILVSPDFFNGVQEDFDYEPYFDKLRQKFQDQQFLNGDGLKQVLGIDKNEHVQVNSAKGTILVAENNSLQESKVVNSTGAGNVVVKKNYNKEAKANDVQSFVSYFRRRYDSLRKILVNRQELQDSISISRLARKEERQSVSIIGLILDKSETKNGNIKIKLEDPSGAVTVLINKNKPELIELAKDMVHDEVIGVVGVTGNNIVFCNNIFLPDIPLNHEVKRAPTEAYAVFISDIHFGIKNFLSTDFMRFLSWLRGEYGSKQQREIASKVKYLFIVGDVVEGVGIYPGQEDDLSIKDIYEQYEEATKYFKLIPERIKIIICGGNHDAIRMSEPQPAFDKQISRGFYELPNMVVVSNPAVVNIDSTEDFPGFDVLMYHGYSFPYYVESAPSIRSKGGLKRCDLIMKYLLQRRHLAPAHGSTLYVPDSEEDNLVIDIIPDVFVSGHVHQTAVSNYKGITMINSSCWVVQSEDNAKRGIIPDPAKIPIINLQTREVKIMNFLSDGVKVLVADRMAEKNG